MQSTFVTIGTVRGECDQLSLESGGVCNQLSLESAALEVCDQLS